MKKNRTFRILPFLLALALILISCAKNDTPLATEESTQELTEGIGEGVSTDEQTTSATTAPPAPEIDPNAASVYSGTPDTSWYTGDKTEYILTTADQFVGMNYLRQDSKGTISFEGITVKLGVDMIINEGTMEEIVARGTKNHTLKELASGYLFLGTFDGQGHTIQGIYMKNTTSNNRGIFGGLGGNAVLKNFTLTNTYTTGHTKAGKHTMGVLVSKIAGEGADVTISNVDIHGTVAEVGYTVDRIGGFVGMVESAVTLTLDTCRLYGSIVSTGEEVGGMIGGASHADAVIVLKNCENHADITAVRYVGGLIGKSVVKSIVQANCLNTGKLTAQEFVGDLFGSQSVFADPANGARPNTPAGYSSLRVMSFNLSMTLSHTNTVLKQPSQNRVRAVEEEILYYAPDIIGFQEDNYLWHGNLKLDGYLSIQDTSIKGERCAIYYKEGLTLLASDTVWLTYTGTDAGAALTYADLTDPNSVYYMTPEKLQLIGVASEVDFWKERTTYVDQKTGQTVTLANGDTYSILANGSKVTWGAFEIDGQVVIHMNTHLQNRGQNAVYSNDAFQKIRSLERVKAFELMQKELARIKQQYPNAVVYMTGDWNDHEYSQIFNTVYDAGYASAHLIATEKYGPAGSWNSAFDASAQGDSYPANKDKEGTTSGYLDYCFVSPEFRVLKFRSGDGKAEITLSDGTKKIIYTSDHLPIVADLCFPTPK